MATGSCSSPAMARAGSPGNSCCSPKMIIETKIRVGMMMAKRRSRNRVIRSEEHTSELQSLMRISYAVFCLKKKRQLRIPVFTHHTLSSQLVYLMNRQARMQLHKTEHTTNEN